MSDALPMFDCAICAAVWVLLVTAIVGVSAAAPATEL